LSTPQEHRLRQEPLRQQIHDAWRFVVVMPDAQMGTAETKRVLPPTLPHAVTARSTGRVIGLLHALARGDEELLAACMFDEVHVPYRRRLVPGMEQALAAGRAAGAAGCTVCGHGPGLIALTTDEGLTGAIARAMEQAFVAVGRQATSLVLQTAHYGALPAQA
jgi:homoserine kinase